MATVDLLTLTFDTDWSFDTAGLFFDMLNETQAVLEGEMTLFPVSMRLRAHIQADEDIVWIDQADFTLTKFLDLLPLVPEVFRSSDVLKQYLEEVGIFDGTYLSNVDDLQAILDPHGVGEVFLLELAKLIGVEIVRTETTPLVEIRRQVTQAIDWYKRKGSYEALQIIAYLSNLGVQLFDLYTSDYISFTRAEWYAGDEGTNPPGIPSNFFKSAHFGLEIKLNRVYTGSTFLWKENLFIPIQRHVELVRPANTVPRYIIFLNPITDQTGSVMEVAGFIRTRVMDTWSFPQLFFDMNLLSQPDWDFDGGEAGEFFDFTENNFINGINTFKLGTGNKGVSPGAPLFAIQTPTLVGSVDAIRILPNKMEFEIVIPSATVSLSLSELGLFSNGGTVLRVASTFPDIDKIAGVELRILVEVLKTV